MRFFFLLFEKSKFPSHTSFWLLHSAELQRREVELRSAFEQQLAATHSNASNAELEVQKERALRQQLEADLLKARLDSERSAQSEEQKRVVELAAEQRDLRAQYEEELERMRHVVEQRVQSEEQQRLAAERAMEARLEAESKRLEQERLLVVFSPLISPLISPLLILYPQRSRASAGRDPQSSQAGIRS